MVNVCSCNLGCASVNIPPAKLRAGAKTRVVSGALRGEQVKVVEVEDATGAKVLALTDLNHDFACQRAIEPALMGYTCVSSKSGPVPAHACEHGCEAP